MGTMVGDILTGVLIVVHIIWDKRQGSLRGIWLQIFGALFVGWDINMLVNIQSAPRNPSVAIIIVGFMALLFYVLASVRRKS